MKHKINPQIDCVFKALLGSLENISILLDFLNNILLPKNPIRSVEIINPYNEKEFLSDKLTIVDIKAKDSQGLQYQIEIQMANYPYLPQRMLYTWSDIYGAQLQGGEGFTQLMPVISIWLLVDNLFNSPAYHHHFQLRDQQYQQLLSDHCSIHVIELNKWQLHKTLKPSEHWLYFFKEAKHWQTLPPQLNTPTMRQAMTTLQRFSEKEQEYHLYQARANAQRDEASKQQCFDDINKEVAEVRKALASSEFKRASSETKLATITTNFEQKIIALAQQLRDAGIEPD